LAVGRLAERYDDWAASREQRDRDDGENAEGEPWPLARPGRCLQSVLHIGSEDVEQGRIGGEFAERGRHDRRPFSQEHQEARNDKTPD
jgi:hypothetical protein